MKRYANVLLAGWLWASYSTCSLDTATYFLNLLPDNRGTLAKVTTSYSPSCIGHNDGQEDNPLLTTIFFPVTQAEAKSRTFEAWITQAER